MKIKILYLASLLLASTCTQATTVSFSGSINNFNPGPFSGFDTFSGSFDLDENIIPTGGGVKTFNGAVNNFVLTVGSYTFTGQNGQATQFSSAGGSSDFFSISLGGVNGSVTGNVGTAIFTEFNVDWRGSDLFSDPGTLAQNLSTVDFSYTRTNFEFDSSVFNTAINNSSEINFGASVVPVPAAAWFFGSSLLGLVSIARRRI